MTLLKRRLRARRPDSRTSEITALPADSPSPRISRSISAPPGREGYDDCCSPGCSSRSPPLAAHFSGNSLCLDAPTPANRIQPRRVASSDAFLSKRRSSNAASRAASLRPASTADAFASGGHGGVASRPPRPTSSSAAGQGYPSTGDPSPRPPRAVSAAASPLPPHPPRTKISCSGTSPNKFSIGGRPNQDEGSASAPTASLFIEKEPDPMDVPRWVDCGEHRVAASVFSLVASFLPVVSLPAMRRLGLCCHAVISSRLMRDGTVRAALDSHLESKRLNSKRVWVVVRARPTEDIGCIKIDRNRVSVSGAGSAPLSIYFDRAFPGPATQEEVGEYVGTKVLPHALNGEHVCIMAYGQTGSGKTHTMFGNLEAGASQQGVAFTAVNTLATLLRGRGASSLAIEFSFLEVYNDELYDLLDGQKKLSRQRSSEKHVVPQGLTRRRCKADQMEEQVHGWLREGAATRTVGKTVFNPRSSRSHGVVMLHLCWGAEGASGGGSRSRLRPLRSVSQTSETRLYLVDLAGSERAGMYAMDPEQLKEGEHINLSLSALGRVVGALSSGKCKHVPYRDSSLTWLLKDAITGTSARVCMLAAVHPAHPAETASTLRYARQYSALQNSGGGRVPELTAEVRDLMRRVDALKNTLKSALTGDEHGIPWTIESLSGTVQPTRDARELVAAHPHLSWTSGHQSKYNVRGQRKDRSGIGRTRASAEDGCPPPRDPSETPDGRLVAGSTAVVAGGAPAEKVVEVVFEGRHGRPPIILWYPESALETVQPPKALLDAMAKAESAEEELAQKRAELRKAQGSVREQEQEWMAKDQG